MEHVNNNTLFESAKNCKFEVCEPCALEKQTKVKFGTIVHHTKGLLDYVKTNVWEPIKVASFGGRNHDVFFGGDMVIKPLHKFKCCLDFVRYLQFELARRGFGGGDESFICGDMHFDLDSYLDLAPSLGAFGVYWRIWLGFNLIECFTFMV